MFINLIELINFNGALWTAMKDSPSKKLNKFTLCNSHKRIFPNNSDLIIIVANFYIKIYLK